MINSGSLIQHHNRDPTLWYSPHPGSQYLALYTIQYGIINVFRKFHGSYMTDVNPLSFRVPTSHNLR